MRHWLTIILLAASIPLAAQHHRSDALDDVLQHAPMAAVFTLKACDFDNSTPWAELALTAVASYTAGAVTA